MTSERVPVFTFTDAEKADGGPSFDTLRQATEAFWTCGCVGFENAFDPVLIASLNAAWRERYGRYLSGERHADALTIGHRRTQITVAVESPFDSPHLYAHPLVFPILQEILGQHCIMGVFGAVVSLPGAEAQHVHRDHPLLFEEAVNATMPTFAVTMMIPLVDLDARTGTTRMWVGSHRMGDRAAQRAPVDDPMIKAGGCLLFDLRLQHQGLANVSETVRPMLYNAYYRPWFTDARNYTVQQPLVMERSTFDRLPRANKRLFVRAETAAGERLTTADPYRHGKG